MLINKLYSRLVDFFVPKKILAHQEAVDQILEWYDGLHNWYVSEAGNIYVENKVDNMLYGEITYQAMEILANKLKPTSRDVFYDLGCGVGKLVTYMYLTRPFNKCVGIEMIGSRYKLAELVWKLADAEKVLDRNRKLVFIHNNIRNEHFKDATIIYMSSLCFPSELMEELNHKFIKLKKGLRIISLISLPPHPSLKLQEVSTLPMTWNENSTIYYYELI